MGDGLLFDGQYTQSSAPIVKWVWDFGDGIIDDTSNSPGVGHMYQAPGSYTIRLTVTDQNDQTGSTTNAGDGATGAGTSARGW